MIKAYKKGFRMVSFQMLNLSIAILFKYRRRFERPSTKTAMFREGYADMLALVCGT